MTRGAAPAPPTAAPGLGVKPTSQNVNEKYQNGITNKQPIKAKTNLTVPARVPATLAAAPGLGVNPTSKNVAEKHQNGNTNEPP